MIIFYFFVHKSYIIEISIYTILNVSVSLGNIYDAKRSEPGSWMVVGIIPAFSMKKALKAGRKKDRMGGCARRRIEILQLSYGKLLENWNTKTKDVKNCSGLMGSAGA